MTTEEIIGWLLKGDVSICYQVHRDLLGEERPELQARIVKEGWGARFLSFRNPDGHWGRKFYQPKWISTHYTLLDLRNLCMDPDNEQVRQTLDLILACEKAEDGGICAMGDPYVSDVCVNGMFLNYASYFGADARQLRSVVDFLLAERMPDGGFNCRSNRSGAVHSSLHSTLSVFEGITEYERNGYDYRLAELIVAGNSCLEFILKHQLFLSDRTGEIIHPGFLRLPYPGRWHYDILRALDAFRFAGVKWDERMRAAIEVLLKKRSRNGLWKLQANYPGKLHFEMERPGTDSRWNTLRAIRVLEFYGIR